MKNLMAVEPRGNDMDNTNSVCALLKGASDDRDLLSVKYMTMLMKSAMYDIQRLSRPPTPQEARGNEIISNLVSIAKELTEKLEGRPHSAIIADNAEMLASSYVGKWLDGAGKSMVKTEVSADDSLTSVSLPLVQIVDEPRLHAEPAAILLPATRPNPINKISICKGSASLLDFVPDYHLDRRTIARPTSTKPLFSNVASEYLAMRVSKKDKEDRGIDIAEMRLNMFITLIGDHPIDTCTSTDLQAFIERMKYWPAKDANRPDHMTADEIIESNQDFRYMPISHSTLADGYIATARAALIYGATRYNLEKSVAGARYTYPSTARRKVPTEPLSYMQISSTFEYGVRSGYLDLAMLPLLALLTGRRLGLLSYLKGSDIRDKFENVWVAQTNGIVMNNGVWQRVPIKNTGSMTFYVLHRFLVDIGFVPWAAAQGDNFIFPELLRLGDPSKSASQYLGRLMKKAGAKQGKGEVFHSFRGGYIAEAGDQDVEKRDRMIQVGHSLGDDEHAHYGFKTLTENKAEMLANLRLNPKIDFSMFEGLDFDKLAAKKRKKGRRG